MASNMKENGWIIHLTAMEKLTIMMEVPLQDISKKVKSMEKDSLVEGE